MICARATTLCVHTHVGTLMQVVASSYCHAAYPLLFLLLCAEGQVLVDGVDLTSLDANWYRSRVGVVSQEPRLFSLTVRDNITYGCPFM